jgi:hypothetical protein
VAITSEQLLDGVKRRIIMPVNGLDDTDVLAFANQVISNELTNLIKSVNQEFFVRRYDITLLQNTLEYDIPYRAIGRALREIKIKYSDNSYLNLPQIRLEQAFMWQSYPTGVGYYFAGDRIALIPGTQLAYSLPATMAVWYYLAPSKLLTQYDLNGNLQYSTVASIAGDSVVVDALPAAYATGSLIDFVQHRAGCEILELDVPIASVSGPNTINFAPSSVPSRLVPGDFIAPAEYSPVVNMLPDQSYSLLETLTSRLVAQSMADYEGMAALEEDAKKYWGYLEEIVTPRMDGEPTILLNPYNISRCNKFSQYSWLFGAR